MKELKKLFAAVLTLAMIASLCACGNSASSTSTGTSTTGSTTDAASSGNEALDRDYIIKVGSNTSPAANYYQVQEWFAEQVNEQTGGHVIVQLYPSNQLGKDAEMVEQVQNGALDMVIIGSGNLTGIVPSWGVLDIPYLVTDEASAEALMNGPVGEALLADLEEVGMVGFGFFNYGFRQIFNSVRPVASMSGLKGLKIRAQSNTHIEAFTLLGANPTTVAWADLYSSASSGAVDGFDLPLVTLVNNSMQEVVDYCTISNHVYSAGSWVMSKKTIDKLPQEYVDIIAALSAEACTKWTEATNEKETECISILEEAGVEVTYLSDEATAEMAAVCAPILDNHKDEFGEEIYNLVMAER